MGVNANLAGSATAGKYTDTSSRPLKINAPDYFSCFFQTILQLSNIFQVDVSRKKKSTIDGEENRGSDRGR